VVLCALAALATPAQAAAPPGPWDAFNLSPASRSVQATGVLKSGGDVTNAAGATNGGVTTIGPGGYVTLDFGKEVGGFARLHFAPGSVAPTAGLTYSEWSTYASPTSSAASNGASNTEPPVIYPAPAGGAIDTGSTQPVPGTPALPLDGANWIWATQGANSSAPASTVYLRRTFTVADPSALASAILRVNVDDNEVTYVNGVQVASMGNSFQTSAIADIKPQLVAGTNVVAIKAANASAGPAGALAKLALGSTTIITDTSWKASQTEQAGWNTAGFDDSAWSNAFANGTYGAGPWGTFADPGPSNGAGTGSATTLTAAAVAGDTSIKVAATTYLTAGTKLDVGGETARVASVSGTTVTLTAPLAQAHASGATVWQANSELRGGFRYLTVTNPGPGNLQLDGASVNISFAPNMSDLRAYPNYFYSDDPLINRIWYAGAYTVQTNIIGNDTGRVWNSAPAIGWNNGAVVGELGGTVLVDGAKRDRTVWPGDLGISVPTDFVSLGDMETIKNSLQTLYNHQNAAGALPYAGPAVNFIGNSDAYHMWTLIGTASYYQYSGDKGWLDAIYPKYKSALNYITAKLGADGLLNVTASADWARANSGGKNIEAEAIMYRTLTTCAAVAKIEGDTATADACTQKAATLKTAVNASGYYNAATGLYRDTPASSVYPQDGNSLAVWFGVVPSPQTGLAISQALSRRWTPVGALTPEKSATSVHPFPGSMEAMAHFQAGDDKAGLDLLRLEWGYMLNAPYGTGSTYWEGYKTDGSSDYSGSYISASHGWSAGPTASLTFYVLGVHPDPDGGPAYDLIPHPGDLHHVEGQLTTPAGVITQSYDANPAAGTFVARYSAPAGALRTVAVPTYGRSVRVLVDGREVTPARTDAGYAYVDAAPGAHTVATCPESSCAIGGVGGTVPATLSLTLGSPASFGAFTPGTDKEYTASTTATVTSTTGDAALTVSDPGHLTNGAFSLPEALRVEFSKASWTGPVSNDAVAITFRQHIGANDALRTGSYSRTLTFTLATTTP
jgi:hypothetical protein